MNLVSKIDRVLLMLAACFAVIAAAAGVYGLCTGSHYSGRWFSTSGLLLTVAGLVQLEVSGLLDKILAVYADEKKYPYGPPSHITRQIIDNPDSRFRTWVRNSLYFNIRTGFWLIIAGTLIQVIGAWV